MWPNAEERGKEEVRKRGERESGSVPTSEGSSPEHGGRELRKAGYGRPLALGLDQGARYTDFPRRWQCREVKATTSST